MKKLAFALCLIAGHALADEAQKPPSVEEVSGSANALVQLLQKQAGVCSQAVIDAGAKIAKLEAEIAALKTPKPDAAK